MPSRLPTKLLGSTSKLPAPRPPSQADVLKKNLTRIILASACKGEREVEKLKAIALRALG